MPHSKRVQDLNPVWLGAFCVQFGRSPFVCMYWCDCECEWLSLLGLQQTGDLFRVSP